MRQKTRATPGGQTGAAQRNTVGQRHQQIIRNRGRAQACMVRRVISRATS